mmetsp:Transcript_34090/g.51411  ORF Transcript_34090/g.51411 Transcript_34090/m.51411 type:complete len:80 (+) Transcript_34090:65-304(+)
MILDIDIAANDTTGRSNLRAASAALSSRSHRQTLTDGKCYSDSDCDKDETCSYLDKCFTCCAPDEEVCNRACCGMCTAR